MIVPKSSQAARLFSSFPRFYSTRSISVYIHWPYCSSICPYCDFNRYVVPSIDVERLEKSYKTEFDYFLSKYYDKNNLEIKSIFFGGGSPSLAPPQFISNIINHINQKVQFASEIEITLEANPTSTETSKMVEWKAAGVNRLSIGVQALSESDLKYLGRLHSLQDALDAIENAKRNFEKFSFDLIYARHDKQTVEEWENELKQAIHYSKGHLSLYTLTIEPNTPFHRKHKNNQGNLKCFSLLNEPNPTDVLAVKLPHDDIADEMYLRTVDICERYGLHQYEISNFASEGNRSIHNLNYWNSGEWIGIGPGAASRINTATARTSFSQVKNPGKWMDSIAQKSHGIADNEELTLNETLEEVLMMGLRTKDGVRRDLFRKYANGKEIEDILDVKILGKYSRYVTLSADKMQLTAEGLPILNYILPEMVKFKEK